MYKKFENLSSCLYTACITALIYTFLLLFCGAVPRIFDSSLFSYFYTFLLAGCAISCLYALAMFFIWTYYLGSFVSYFIPDKKYFAFFVILSFFIPVYNLFAPYSFFAKAAGVLKVDGMKLVVAAWQTLFWIVAAALCLALYMGLLAMDLFSYRLSLYAFAMFLICNILYLAVLLSMITGFGDGFKDFYERRADIL